MNENIVPNMIGIRETNPKKLSKILKILEIQIYPILTREILKSTEESMRVLKRLAITNSPAKANYYYCSDIKKKLIVQVLFGFKAYQPLWVI